MQAEQLQGQEKLTHPFARVRVEDQSQLTTVQWQSLNPVWEETLFFRDVCAASELVVEVWDVGGQKSSEQLQRITIDPVKLIANSRFQGRVEVPLSETLRLRRGEPPPPGMPLIITQQTLQIAGLQIPGLQIADLVQHAWYSVTVVDRGGRLELTACKVHHSGTETS